jgi:NADH dehydrogenase
VLLTDGEFVPTRTVVWCVGVRPDPLAESLGLPMERGRLLVDPYLQVPGRPEVFACGDAAAVPDLNEPGQYTPMTAQHAWRHGKICAHNVAASLGVGERRPYRHSDMGFVVDLGGTKAAANPLGVSLSGPAAGAVTRGYHLAAMPGNRVRVAADWLLDAVLPRQAVQLGLVRSWSVPLDTASPELARVPGGPEGKERRKEREQGEREQGKRGPKGSRRQEQAEGERGRKQRQNQAEGEPRERKGGRRPGQAKAGPGAATEAETGAPGGGSAGDQSADEPARSRVDPAPERSRPGGESPRDQSGADPATNRVDPEPAKGRSGPEAAKNQPGGEPAKGRPGGEPAKNQPGGEPAKNQPGPEPAKNQPASRSTPRPETAEEHPAPGPVKRTDTSAEAEGDS